MEGGGVKGIGLVGALSVLTEHGYTPRRVAGTSAGAIIGSLTAAGMPVDVMRREITRLDYRKFRDEDFIDRLGIVGKGASLLFEEGIYEGDYLRKLLQGYLGELGVKTFGDLRITEPWAQELPPEQRYKLVVLTADITRGRLVRLPWDYHLYGLDPDEQLVADAVRASMSLPFFYEPARLGKSLLVDGGVLSNFPIDLFDDISAWPTFGIKLSARPEGDTRTRPADGPVEFAQAILQTMLNAHDQMHLDDPCTLKRTMFVDAAAVKTTDFDITPAQQELLYQNGRKGAEKFLAGWDFADYKAQCKHPLKPFTRTPPTSN
ncbi:MAG: Conserved rane protein of unknown function [Patescibacteria group bacterium]|nr:Conserved rane protein of unknown function [Patescibacteria group bacterium]